MLAGVLVIASLSDSLSRTFEIFVDPSLEALSRPVTAVAFTAFGILLVLRALGIFRLARRAWRRGRDLLVLTSYSRGEASISGDFVPRPTRVVDLDDPDEVVSLLEGLKSGELRVVFDAVDEQRGSIRETTRPRDE